MCQLFVCGRKRGVAKERVFGRECLGESGAGPYVILCSPFFFRRCIAAGV